MSEVVIHYFEGNTETFPGIQVTIKSLREVYSGEIIFLYKNISNKLKDFLVQQNVNLVDCSTYKVLFDTSPYNNKIIYTYLFLREREQELQKSKVLFCDVGDVYFTSSPFSIQEDKLLFSLETDSISSCEVNRTWLNICYGEGVTKAIENNIVINSGIILGTFTQIKNLFNNMLDDMSRILAKINYPITDQAIVNKLVYFNKIDCVLNNTDITNFSQSPDRDITNKINHQYKVNKQHTEVLYDRYCK